MSLKRVIMMAGGTGGHVFPALAVAQSLQARGVDVHWFGTEQGIEARVVRDAGLPLSFIKISGLRGKGLAKILLAPVKIIRAIWQSLKLIRQQQPDLVIGMGGFVTGPGGIAARLSGRKLIIHEQNAIAGMTNKWLAKIASRVLQAFPSAFKQSNKVFTVGNPVRSSIQATDIQEHDSNVVNILIVGGSLGAQALNETIPQVYKLLDGKISLNIWHQTGKDKLESTRSLYGNNIESVNLVEFIDDMASAYQWADLVVCRAGAMTIAELTNAARAAILIPYPFAVDDHQTANAHYLSDADAAILIQQSNLNADMLAEHIYKLSQQNKKPLKEMAEAASRLSHRDATDAVVQHCLEVCHGE